MRDDVRRANGKRRQTGTWSRYVAGVRCERAGRKPEDEDTCSTRHVCGSTGTEWRRERREGGGGGRMLNAKNKTNAKTTNARDDERVRDSEDETRD